MATSTETQKCKCGGNYQFNRYCGADLCEKCGDHKNLSKCYCGWSVSGGDGRRELIEDGETIEPEEFY